MNMTIKEIYAAFDKIGCLTFATINEVGYPETRIAHLRGYDEQGVYFMTMNTKPFYKQLVDTGKISICGMSASTKVTELEDGNLYFEPGYTARLTGDVIEIDMKEIKEKAKKNSLFEYCVEDQERYPSMVTFCITKFTGEIFKYDFEKQHMDHKLLRTRFSYGDFPSKPAGLTIKSNCIKCGRCYEACTFDAIHETELQYQINGSKCDECGSCFLVCPTGAVSIRE